MVPVARALASMEVMAADAEDFAFLLQPAAHRDHGRRHDLTPVDLEPVGPEDAVGDAGLVLDRDEQNAFGRSRALANKDDAGDLDIAAVAYGREIGAAHDP